jgi:hypothetical protein
LMIKRHLRYERMFLRYKKGVIKSTQQTTNFKIILILNREDTNSQGFFKNVEHAINM